MCVTSDDAASRVLPFDATGVIHLGYSSCMSLGIKPKVSLFLRGEHSPRWIRGVFRWVWKEGANPRASQVDAAEGLERRD